MEEFGGLGETRGLRTGFSSLGTTGARRAVRL